MPQALIYILVAVVVLLPLVAAVALRVLRPRFDDRLWYGLALVLFGIVFASVLALGRNGAGPVQIGGLAVLQPYEQSTDVSSNLPAATEPAPTLEVAPTELPGAAPGASTQLTPTLALATPEAPVASPLASAVPTATPEPPTATPEPPTPEPPTATPEPPTATPEPPTATPAPAEPQRYTVQPGDTLRSIAERFGVSVQAIIEANNLTPAQADNLRVGQVLVIPTP
jgi:LysM repeat protein